MTWNYRIVRYKDGGFGLHEVYYDDAGKPKLRTEDPISFVVAADEGVGELISGIAMAMADISRLPVLDDWEPPAQPFGAED